MNLQQQFENFIRDEKLFNASHKLLAAVSGGVDSVVLCHLLKKSGFHFAMAHCNFNLRGEESEGDENFVKALAADLEVAFHCKKFDTQDYAANHKLSIQEAARELRYDWFSELTGKDSPLQYDYILTAHHADDNAETVMMNFFKGTGIKGLKGILPKRDRIIRPLLFASKEMITHFAEEYLIEYRSDSSNNNPKYTRNAYRNIILPEIEKLVPGVKQNIINATQTFRDLYFFHKDFSEKAIAKLIQTTGAGEKIPVLALQKHPHKNILLFEICLRYGFHSSQVHELDKLLAAETGRQMFSETHRLLKNRKWLLADEKQTPPREAIIVIGENDREITFGDRSISFSLKDKAHISKDLSVACLDSRMITFPLILRKWKTGDYFYPLGMNKKKKLSRFFIDQKLSLAEKENIWILESNKRIAWILGHRIDDRFKVVPGTTSVLELKVNHSKPR